MKTFQACLMAEFRRALPFLPWLLGLHAMTLGARTRWAGEFSNQLVAMIDWTSWGLALLITVISLWHDAPLRRERFLSTRPQCFLPLFSAKWIALTLMIVLPFGLVDFLALRSGGISGKFLWLGTLQTLLLFLAALCALFPAVWWWRGVSSGLTTLGVTSATLIGTGFSLSWQIGNRSTYGGEWLGFPLGMQVVFGFLVSFGLSAALMLGILKGRGGLLRIPLFALLACLCLWIGLRISIQPPKADETVNPSLVFIGCRRAENPAKRFELFGAGVSAANPPPDINVTWIYSKLEIDGHDVRPWRRDRATASGRTLPMKYALARGLGGRSVEVPEESISYQSNTAILPGGLIANRSHDIDLEILETRHRWELVANLPLKSGAQGSVPGSHWSIVEVRSDQIQTPEGTHEDLKFKVDAIHSDIWLAAPDSDLLHHWSSDSAYIVDSVTGAARWIQPRWVLDATSSLKHAIYQKERNRFPWRDPKDQLDMSHDLRFVVLRPHVVNRTAHRWKSPGKIRMESPPKVQPLPTREHQMKPEELAEWLAAHPVPTADAQDIKTESWFEEFFPLACYHQDQFRNDHDLEALREAVRLLIRTHPKLILNASVRYGRMPWLIHREIPKNLPRDVVKRFPELATNPFVMETFAQNGWAADLAEMARNEARKGMASKVDPILLAVPKEVSLTENEWLDYFRLHQSAVVYKALAGTAVSRELMDREADLILTGFTVNPRTDSTSRRLELALARGESAAPRWLQEDFMGRIASSKIRPSHAVSHQLLDVYFNAPEVGTAGKDHYGAADKQIEWFLSIDPASFVFDPATRKYQLRSDS